MNVSSAGASFACRTLESRSGPTRADPSTERSQPPASTGNGSQSSVVRLSGASGGGVGPRAVAAGETAETSVEEESDAEGVEGLDEPADLSSDDEAIDDEAIDEQAEDRDDLDDPARDPRRRKVARPDALEAGYQARLLALHHLLERLAAAQHFLGTQLMKDNPREHPR